MTKIDTITGAYPTLRSALIDCLNQPYWAPQGLPVFPLLAEDDVKVAVVYGDNASGKSFFFKKLINQLKAPLKPFDIQEILLASMSMRVSSSEHQMFMYPREKSMSTGANSVGAVKGCFYNAKNRSHPVWLFLDEPDVGLSDRYAQAMGTYLAAELNALPEHIKGVCIVTHSRTLLLALMSELKQDVHQISMGLPLSLVEFIQAQDNEPASIEELLNLRSAAVETSRKIHKIEENSSSCS